MRFLRATEVAEKVGLSQTTIWRLERDGDFPRRRQLGPNSVGWLESEIEEWMASREVAQPATAGGGSIPERPTDPGIGEPRARLQ